MTPTWSAAGFQLPCSTCIISSNTFLWGCKNFTFPSQPRGESNKQKLHHVIMVIMPVNRAPHSINTASTSHCWEQLCLQLCSCCWSLGTDLSPSPDLNSKAQKPASSHMGPNLSLGLRKLLGFGAQEWLVLCYTEMCDPSRQCSDFRSTSFLPALGVSPLPCLPKKKMLLSNWE